MELVLEGRKIIRAFPKLDKCGIVPDFQIILGAFLMGNSPLIILYGLAAAASLVSTQLGILIFIAILLHKLPEGFTVASMMLAARHSSRSALLASFSIGLATLAGVALVLLFQSVAVYSRPLSYYVLPLS